MEQARCHLCGARSPLIAAAVGVCLECLRREPETAAAYPRETHRQARLEFGLPEVPPRAADGVRCGLCARDCLIPDGGRGFCGLRVASDGRLAHLAGTPARGLLHWYRDPLPTNCVADWVCPGHRQLGQHNLAVFYASCTLDCLFCQNWHFREADPTRDRKGTVRAMTARELAACGNARTYCVCFFGGDPASQMPHALASAKHLADGGVSVCWETAGTMHPKLLRRALDLSLQTGGCIKFDLKAYDSNLHRALTGASNRRTLVNFAAAVERAGERPDPPLVVASTLLVPGYVDSLEVGRIARFIARLDPDTPYALLGFHPHFFMPDLPRTSVRHATEALEAARAAGLRRVRLGNPHLLSRDY